MPILEKIIISDFRNIALQELDFSPNINCISGNNGEGKTNLLDAVYYLSMTKSAFATSDRFNFRHGTTEFALSGSYRMENDSRSKISMKVTSKGDKKILRDDKSYQRISSHIGLIPIVMVSPSDISLVSESGEERRRFINSVLSQMDSAYLGNLQQYNRLLAQRNKLLKEPEPDRNLLEVIDMRMAALSVPIYQRRSSFVSELEPVIKEYYRAVSSGSEQVAVNYESDLDDIPASELAGRTMEADLACRFTTKGIHRDDLNFSMNGWPIRKYGSQGQQKSFLVALKFAQYEIMKKAYGFPPILLLDDIFDKLDMERISNLLKMVSGKDFGQIFITDSNKVRLSGIVDSITSDRTYYDTREGTFTIVGKELTTE